MALRLMNSCCMVKHFWPFVVVYVFAIFVFVVGYISMH